jgi:hypothetical protein
MDRTWDAGEEGLAGGIQTNDFYAVADLDIGFNKLAHSPRRTAVGRRKTGDDMKYMQRRPRSTGKLEAEFPHESCLF